MNTVSLHPAMLPMSPLSAPTAESGPQQAEAAKKLAQDFESLFVSMLIKQMRQSSTEDGMFPGDSSDTLYTGGTDHRAYFDSCYINGT